MSNSLTSRENNFTNVYVDNNSTNVHFCVEISKIPLNENNLKKKNNKFWHPKPRTHADDRTKKKLPRNVPCIYASNKSNSLLTQIPTKGREIDI